jgi:hypothetical protein
MQIAELNSLTARISIERRTIPRRHHDGPVIVVLVLFVALAPPLRPPTFPKKMDFFVSPTRGTSRPPAATRSADLAGARRPSAAPFEKALARVSQDNYMYTL